MYSPRLSPLSLAHSPRAPISPSYLSVPLGRIATTTTANESSLFPSPPSPTALRTPLPPSSPISLNKTSPFADLFVPEDFKEQPHLLHGKHFELFGLDVTNRAQMSELMALKATRAACEMASEVVGIIVPALPKNTECDMQTRILAEDSQRDAIARALHLWVNLSPSPLVVLIVTVILLERLIEVYPRMGGDVISRDAPLRIAFASFLLATKMTSEVTHVNSSFVKYTPTSWELNGINTMERQLFRCLRWDLWISSEELLHRASGFWTEHQTLSSASSSASSSSDDSSLHAAILSSGTSNLFLMHPRTGVNEQGWRDGLVRGAGQSGRRISKGDVHGESTESNEHEETTVWYGGRLQRRRSSDEHGN